MSLKPPTAHRDKKMARRLGRSKLARYRRRIRERYAARELARHAARYPPPTTAQKGKWYVFLLLVSLRALASKVVARVATLLRLRRTVTP